MLTAFYRALVNAAPPHVHRELVATLRVPDGKRVSLLEWTRTAVAKLSGTVIGMEPVLDFMGRNGP
jgi:hypothetical protein